MYNVLIRPLREQDAHVSWKWRNDPDVWKYTGKRPDRRITKEIEIEWIKAVLAEKDSFRFAIMADGNYIGNIQLTNIVPGEEGEYHIFIGEKGYWGQGIATRASLQLIRYAREILKLKKLYLYVKPGNEAALRVYHKTGFVQVSDEIRMDYDLRIAIVPKVSVFMMAYNHERFIKKSIESILFQKTDFDYDIVIGEDCSSDNTRAVIRSIADQYPGSFVLLLHENNVGPHANQRAVFEACRGEYIAMCEGDDYWTDPMKLMRQVRYLDGHPDTGMICTNYSKYYDQEERFRKDCFNLRAYSDQVKFSDYILDMSSISTATVMLRNDLLRSYFSEISGEMIDSFIVGDTPLWLFIAAKSRIGVLKEETAVYRILHNSACHFNDPADHYKFVLKGFEMADYFYSRYGN
ncbi:MAG: GNAT family N-acetyltransferase, partial [Bacteroidales bacterium]|nr:GNAT family N-acetyltransferase [Bacteroidales bacterium]